MLCFSFHFLISIKTEKVFVFMTVCTISSGNYLFLSFIFLIHFSSRLYFSNWFFLLSI